MSLYGKAEWRSICGRPLLFFRKAWSDLRLLHLRHRELLERVVTVGPIKTCWA